MVYYSYYLHIGCIEDITLRTTTAPSSRINDPQTEDRHKLEITVNGVAKSVAIPCNSGTRCNQGQTGVFNFDIVQFELDEACVRPADISEVALVAVGNDGWFIDAAFTTYTTCRFSVPGTVDVILREPVDGNGISTDSRRVVLTRVE